LFIYRVFLDVFETYPRKKHGHTRRCNEIFVKEKKIDRPQAIGLSDIVPDPRLLQDEGQRLGRDEPEDIHIQQGFQLGGEISIQARPHEKEPWIDEIRLPLILGAAQVGQETEPVHNVHAGLSEPDGLPVEETETSAGKVDVVNDRIESPLCTIPRL